MSVDSAAMVDSIPRWESGFPGTDSTLARAVAAVQPSGPIESTRNLFQRSHFARRTNPSRRSQPPADDDKAQGHSANNESGNGRAADVCIERQEWRVDPVRGDVDAVEARGCDQAGQVPFARAALENPRPRATQDALGPTRRRARLRDNMLDETEPSSWNQDPPDLGENGRWVVDRAENQAGDDGVRTGVR